MDYYKWKRKIKIRALFCLLSASALGLLLLHELTVYAEHNTPVKIRYPLSEIPENQAVIKIAVLHYDSPGDNCWITANKEGRWKIYTDYYYREFEEKYGELHFMNEYEDYILESERIPWQPGRINIDSKVLEQALNMQNVKFIFPRSGNSASIGIYWDLISPAEKREDINYFEGASVDHRHIVHYMQNKFQELEEAGRQVYDYPYMYHVNGKN